MSRASRVTATAKRRARILEGLARQPADAWLVVRMLCWRLALPVLKRALPLPRLVRLMWAGPGPGAPPPERLARIAELGRIVYRSEHHSRAGNCLERSLVLYRYMSAAGADPELLVGLRADGATPRGHAWVTVNDAEVEEPPEALKGLARVVAFGDGGSRAEVNPARAGQRS
jgi:Transglutaminase-like superfamily